MLNGAHAVIFSREAERDRAFLRDALGLPHVDAGDGWLIFGLPPAEVAVHPSDENDLHELYLMCGDVEAFVAQMARQDIPRGPIRDLGWGRLTQVVLPGGGKLGFYEPNHARPEAPQSGGRRGAGPGALLEHVDVARGADPLELVGADSRSRQIRFPVAHGVLPPRLGAR